MWAIVMAMIIWIFIGVAKTGDSLNRSLLDSSVDSMISRNTKSREEFSKKYAASPEDNSKALLQAYDAQIWEEHYRKFGSVEPTEYCKAREVVMAIKMKDRIMKEAKLREKDFNPYMITLGVLAQDGKIPEYNISMNLECSPGTGKGDALHRFYMWWNKELMKHGLKSELVFVPHNNKSSFVEGNESVAIPISTLKGPNSGFVTWREVKSFYSTTIEDMMGSIYRAVHFA